MLFSRSAEYAIAALGHLGELPDGTQRMARRIAEAEALPAFFLAKTLQLLARQGVLRSAKGPTGGFALARPAQKIRLIDVIEAIDGPDDIEQGSAGLPSFRPVRQALMGYFKNTTVADVAAHRARARKAAKKAPARKKSKAKAARKR